MYDRMNSQAANIKTIVYNRNERDSAFVRRFLSLDWAEKIRYDDEEHLRRIIIGLKKGYASKEVLILSRNKGRFIQQCPCSPSMMCCDYRIINSCYNCVFDCTYCYLHSYLNNFGIVQFSNIDDLYSAYSSAIESASECEKLIRIGTGQYTDSLMLDDISGIGERLISISSGNKNVLLELKTKSDNIHHLLDIADKGNAVLSWTLNTPENIANYEKGTATLDERIKAAGLASCAGYNIAFHFDPIILGTNHIEEYRAVVNQAMNEVDVNRVLWISMGCFRYAPGFKEILRETHPRELLTIQEMFPGPDGKYRYLKSKRIEIYTAIRDCIESYTKRPFIYLCMETADVWRTVFDKPYQTSEDMQSDMVSRLAALLA